MFSPNAIGVGAASPGLWLGVAMEMMGLYPLGVEALTPLAWRLNC